MGNVLSRTERERMILGSREEIGGRLKAERERLAKNMGGLADLLNVARTTQNNYENGTNYPDLGYLTRFAEAGGDAYYVLTGHEEASIEMPELLWKAFLFTRDYADGLGGGELSAAALGEMVIKFYKTMLATAERQKQKLPTLQSEANH